MSVELTGTTANVNGIAYYIPPKPVAPVNCNNGRDSSPFQTIVVVRSSNGNGTLQLTEKLAQFEATDDVFQPAFAAKIFFINTLDKKAQCCDKSFQCHDHQYLNLPEGPYFLGGNSLFEAYRLYSDIQGAFSETVIGKGDGFDVLPANLPGQSLAVAVPSRLYHPPSHEKPLAGIRLGIKDLYDLKGVKKSSGSRAWYHLYPSANESAVAVQNLIDAGAIVVGKMKTSQFANGETATADWVDYHAPFNPRGDGYQDGSSSSTGPAAGVASYPWLDISLGSDTGGSIRSPSQIQGLYGNRPTHGIVSLRGATPLATHLDTPGIFSRDPKLWATAAKALYGAEISFGYQNPSKIYTIGFPSNNSTPLNSLFNGFLRNLTSHLSVAAEELDLNARWAEYDANPLPSLLNHTYEVITGREQGAVVRPQFYSDYASAHDGRQPFVDPSPLDRWAFGDMSPSLEEALANKTAFMDWFTSKMLYRDDKSCSQAILAYVPRIPTTKYRDAYLTGPSKPYPFATGRISVMSGVPDMVVTIGEIEYQSRVTKATEYLPVTVDLMAARGCDGALFDIITGMYEKGMLPKVKTGRSLVTGGRILT